MKSYFTLFVLISCASYTDPEQEKLTYYKCEKKQELVVKHSDDYETMRLKYKDQQILLHHFVLASGVGYRNENYLFLTSGNKAKLIALRSDGTEDEVLGTCKTLDVPLQY